MLLYSNKQISEKFSAYLSVGGDAYGFHARTTHADRMGYDTDKRSYPYWKKSGGIWKKQEFHEVRETLSREVFLYHVRKNTSLFFNTFVMKVRGLITQFAAWANGLQRFSIAVLAVTIFITLFWLKLCAPSFNQIKIASLCF